MANHKSSVKRTRQTVRREARNVKAKKAIKTFEKKLIAALDSKDLQAAENLFKDYSAKIQRAATKGIVHIRKASRKISRLALKIKKTAK